MVSAPPKTPLIEFTYASKASEELPDAALLRLAQQAWSHNTRLGVTGSLPYEDGTFHQIIEGPSDVLLPLVSRILTDARHEAISILGFRPISTRRFETWRAIGFDMDSDIPFVESPHEPDLTASARRDVPARVASVRA
jgi:hypothetical protein